MKNRLIIMFLLTALFQSAQAQSLSTGNPAFDAELSQLLSFSIPAISVQELQSKQHNAIILDAREHTEYEVSHIPGAIHIGYDQPDFTVLNDLEKDKPLVLYCSVGYRSEKIGEQLKERGFKNVYNLYGSIFEWANKGYPLENKEGKNTQTVHTYNEEWSKWIKNPHIRKTWQVNKN